MPYLLGSSEQGIVQIIKRVHFGLGLKIWVFWEPEEDLLRIEGPKKAPHYITSL
jgi:hypothetical protein